MMSATKECEVKDLDGNALDWAVATAYGLNPYFDGESLCLHSSGGMDPQCQKYSTDWTAGGRVIDLEDITVGDASHLDDFSSRSKYMAIKGFPEGDNEARAHGDTKLVAAMRCFVISRMGPVIQVPTELTLAADDRYPYTYACDYLRELAGRKDGSTILSRSDAAQLRFGIASALSMDDEMLARQLADRFLANEEAKAKASVETSAQPAKRGMKP